MPARTHGDSYSGEYRIWRAMRQRCENERNPAYKNYGARGITVCKRWLDYPKFLQDMGRRPSPQHTIERIDNNLGYLPRNCRWATRAEQLQNKRNTIYVVFRGAKARLQDVARMLGKRPSTILYRAIHGKKLDGEDYARD